MNMEGMMKPGSESQDSDEPAPPGTSKEVPLNRETDPVPSGITPTPLKTQFKLTPSLKGVKNAKKRLRAFSIQKKTPITPITIPKPISTGNATVLIGKLSGVKVTPKVQDDPEKKPPKPPKPGMARKLLQDSYTALQKRTLTEIEDMKRKMELVELGIPLGLICPSPSNEKAMPTKAMPPIKTFLDPAKLDEIINEAKIAKAEGKPFKFDYSKVLPDYDNPFQRKKEEAFVPIHKSEEREHSKREDKDRKNSDRYDGDRRHSYRKDDKEKRKDDRDKTEKKDKSHRKDKKPDKRVGGKGKETDVDLNDYLVCDSWSLDNEDRTSSSSPRVALKKALAEVPEEVKGTDSPKVNSPVKMQKLQPVMDSFKYEIDEDEILDMFDENIDLGKFSKVKPKKDDMYESPDLKLFDSNDTISDDTFLESVINEIKQEEMSEDESQDKGLVEYDSPTKDDSKERLSVTPELDDRMRNLQSSRSDYSDGYRSTESGYKSTESGYKSSASIRSVDSRSDSFRMSMDKDTVGRIAKSTVDSLETWSFVLKICQPLLFRHDRNKCYKETRVSPKLWYTENPKVCNCVKDRSVVYEELEMCKMSLVDQVYSCNEIVDAQLPKARGWYPRFAQCLTEYTEPKEPVQMSTEWETNDSQSETPNAERRGTCTPQRSEEIYLDREYQRFMEAVWPEAVEIKSPTPRSMTPVRQETRKKKKTEDEKLEEKKRVKKIKLSSENWSQESEIEEEVEKSKKVKADKDKVRKRKLSISLSDSDDEDKRRKKELKKKTSKKNKTKASRLEAKRRRLSKKYLKKLKDKQKKKKKLMKDEQDSEEDDDERRKKEKKLKKKKQQKKKKAQKKKAKEISSSSSSSTSSSSSSDTTTDSESELDRRKKKHQAKKKKRKQSSSESQEELFDVNILKNIKTERLTDDEKMEISPRKKPREIINVKELQNDFIGNNIHIKNEAEDKEVKVAEKAEVIPMESFEMETTPESEYANETNDEKKQVEHSDVKSSDTRDDDVTDSADSKGGMLFKEPQELPEPITTPQLRPDENLSQCSSQDSAADKEHAAEPYEKDDSHLRPSSQNSNYSFNDVISASQAYQKDDDMPYEEGNYEMYEHMAMAYQSDVAKQGATAEGSACVSQRIETVVRGRSCGEIKCDWRAGDAPLPLAPAKPARPSRWGLKPGEVNIVLTGGGEISPVVNEPVYQIQSLANRTDNTATSYDEAYEDTYGAADRLQYGDCFATPHPPDCPPPPRGANTLLHSSSLDDRINRVLKSTVLGEVAKDTEDPDADRDSREKGILLTKVESRGAKRVSFADGYKPGQDSDLEDPPIRKKKKQRRFGCAWPCAASHADHVPLWDALPPPPPPPGDPPPAMLVPPFPLPQKMDQLPLSNFMPPEPPPGIINFT